MQAILIRRAAGLICVAMTAGLFVIGLWPFSFNLPNNVHWLADRAGLRFRPHGMAYDPQLLPADSHVPLNQGEAFTVEIWLKADAEPDDNVFHILTIDDGHLPSNFALCQWNSGILVRIPANRYARETQEVGVAGALKEPTPRFLTVVGDRSGTVLYLDGTLAERYSDFVLPARTLKGRLILGDSTEGKHSWTGKLFGLAIFSRALDAADVARHHSAWTNNLAKQLANESDLVACYHFDQRNAGWAQDSSPNGHRLLIPPRYQVLHKTVLVPPWTDFSPNLSGLRDVLINILGFAPFGFCVLLYCQLAARERPILNAVLTVCAGAAVSLLIELIQVWLPIRVSSATDLVCNILGTLLGVLLARIVMRNDGGVRSRSAIK